MSEEKKEKKTDWGNVLNGVAAVLTTIAIFLSGSGSNKD